MKIIFALLPEKGHIHPYIGPAQALQDLGFEVSVVSAGDISEQIQRAGLAFHNDVVQSEMRPPAGKELVELVQDFDRQTEGIQHFFVTVAELLVERFEKFFRKAQPALVVADPMNYAAVIASEKLGIRWVGISSALNSVLSDEIESDVLKMVDALKPKRHALFERHGVNLDFRAIDVLSPHLNLTFATKEFIGRVPNGIELVGASRPLRARGDEVPLRPLPEGVKAVYVSFGSQVYYFPEVFAKVVEATRELGVFAVFSLGELMDEPAWQTEPGHCHFYRYAPQTSLLPKVQCFVTHGGANSVMESLTAGVPMLVSAVCNDQPHQSFFVEKAGVGRALDLRSASVDEISAGLQRILSDAAMSERVRELSLGYQANGAFTAARKIAELVSR